MFKSINLENPNFLCVCIFQDLDFASDQPKSMHGDSFKPLFFGIYFLVKSLSQWYKIVRNSKTDVNKKSNNSHVCCSLFVFSIFWYSCKWSGDSH